MTSNLYPQTLPQQTAKLIDVFQVTPPSFLSDFYLSGRTGLSLHLGHRESEDLDFFNPQSFDPRKIQSELEAYGVLENLELADNTLNAYLSEVKLQFLGYPYPLLEKPITWQKIQISSVLDIACTKLQTIGMRGSKKDFVDLYFIFKQYTLEELFQKTTQKYQKADFNKIHILKSLVYFEDAQEQPMPRMHKSVSWEEVKDKMISVVKTVSI